MAENALSGGGIWGLANKPTVALKDPNETLRDVLDTQRKVYDNKLAQAGVARGEALQQATSPLSGQTDMGKANAIMAGNPLAGLAMPGAIDQAQTVNTSQAELSIKRNDYTGRALGALNKLPDDQIHDGAINTVSDMVNQGLIDQTTGMRMLARMPTDAAGARLHLQRLQIGTMPAGSGREAIYGTPGTRDDGNTIQTGGIAPGDQGYGFNPAISTQRQLSPAERTAPQQIGVDARGAPVYGTRQQYIDRAGGDPGATAGGALGDGRFPASLRNPNRQGGPAAAPVPAAPPQSYSSAASGGGVQPAPNAAPGGGIVMGMGPAQTAAMTRTGGDSAGTFQQIADQGVQARSQSATLGTMLADTQHFDSGKTAWNDFQKGFMRRAPSWAAEFGIKPEAIASLESFDKFANQLAGQQGSGSDARLAVAQNANPSSAMSKEGVDLVLRQLQGNSDYLQARAQLAAQHPDKADSTGFEATTGRQLDPRAFQVYRMTPAQRQTYDRGLSETDRAQVRASYNFAHNNGLFSAPAAGPAAQPPAPAAAAPPPRSAVVIPPSAQRPAPPPPPMPNPLAGQPRAPVGNNLRGY